KDPLFQAQQGIERPDQWRRSPSNCRSSAREPNSLKLSRSDSNHRHHSAGFSFFRPMGEELAPIAGRTLLGNRDLLFWNSQGQQLPPVGLGKVQVKLGTEITMPRSTGIHEEQRIFFPHRIRLKYLVKQFAPIGK